MMKIDLMIALLTPRAAELTGPAALLQKKTAGLHHRERYMNRPADSFSLSLNTQSTHPNHAGLQAVNASQLHREKTDFACLGGQVNKTFNHAHLVTAVTDSYSFTLIVCSYSASSICELAKGSSSGEARPNDSRASQS